MHDGRRIVTGSKDQTVRIWDLIGLECQRTLKGHTDAIWDVAVATDDSFVVSASKDDMLKVTISPPPPVTHTHTHISLPMFAFDFLHL